MKEWLLKLILEAEKEFIEDPSIGSIEEHVAQYLIENHVIVPPCFVSDIIWYIDKNNNVQSAEISRIDIRGSNYHIIATRYDEYKEDFVKIYFFFEDFNKRFWMSKKEAEEHMFHANI